MRYALSIFSGKKRSRGAFSIAASRKLVQELVDSGLFDERFYLAQIEGPFSHALGAAGHYLEFGAKQGLQPHALFDPQYYLSHNNFSAPVSLPPLLHYLRSTGTESYNPHPLFDSRFYLESDLDLQVLARRINPLRHYLLHPEHDPHPLFDSKYYTSQLTGADARAENPLVHYLTVGFKQGLSPHEFFDPDFYSRQFPEIEESGLNPLVHFVLLDKGEVVSPYPLFDPPFYLSQLTEAERELASTCLHPLVHFLRSAAGRVASPHPAFDVAEYARRYSDLAGNRAHLFLHYLQHGAREGRNPSEGFSSHWYLSRKPHLVAAGRNPLLDFVSSPEDGRFAKSPFLSTGEEGGFFTAVGEQFARQNDLPVLPVDTVYDELLGLSEQPFSHLFVIPGMVRGGAERAAGSYIRFCQKRYGYENVLVIMADYFEHTTLHWLSDRTRLIDARKLLPSSCRTPDMAILLAAFINKRAPSVIHVINSYSAMVALSEYQRALPVDSRFLVYLFGFETYADNDFALLRKYEFHDAIAFADGVLTDTARLATAVKQLVPSRLEPGKITEECYLSPEHLEARMERAIKRSSGRRRGRKILWASRLVRSKRPDVLVAVARRLPDVEFLVFGSSDLEDGGAMQRYQAILRELPNVTLSGEFSDFDQMDLSAVAGFLYTSDSDGLPLVLLEATVAGLPVIAPRVGGVGELFTRENSWLIRRFDDVDAYVAAVEEMLSSEDLASEKQGKALEALRNQHSAAAFAATLDGLPQFFPQEAAEARADAGCLGADGIVTGARI